MASIYVHFYHWNCPLYFFCGKKTGTNVLSLITAQVYDLILNIINTVLIGRPLWIADVWTCRSILAILSIVIRSRWLMTANVGKTLVNISCKYFFNCHFILHNFICPKQQLAYNHFVHAQWCLQMCASCFGSPVTKAHVPISCKTIKQAFTSLQDIHRQGADDESKTACRALFICITSDFSSLNWWYMVKCLNAQVQ